MIRGLSGRRPLTRAQLDVRALAETIARDRPLSAEACAVKELRAVQGSTKEV
jgi:hypothetical protein